MTTSRPHHASWAVPATVGVVAAGATAAVTWAALVPPAAGASAPPASARPETVHVVSPAEQAAVDRAARDLEQARRRLRTLLRTRLPVTGPALPAAAGVGGAVPAPAPAPVQVAPAPPPVQVVTGASGATH